MSVETRIERGIYRRGAAGPWRVYVSINGRLVARRFPAKWPLTKVRQARQALDTRLREKAEARPEPERPDPGTFAQDAALYLRAVRTMPTYKGRKYDIDLWVAIFGHRRRETIRSIEIDAVLQRWLVEGYAGSTVRGRRTALMHLWTRLDGKGSPNPVKSSMLPPTPEPEPRSLPFSMIRVLLHLIPPGKTRARLAVMAFTGLAPSQIKLLERADLDLANGLVWVRPRRKGKGARGFTKPLTRDGVDALRRFAELNAFGPYSQSSAHHTFRRACRRLALADVRPYDLRHSYITELYAASGDIRATQVVAGHASVVTTMRYALRAVDERARAAVTALSARLDLPSRPTTAP